MALTKVDISLMDNTGTTANKLLAYDGSGNLPAVDGSQLTNVATGITESSSDPALDTNPSGGVGTQWNNTTSGKCYICTDATAGSNVWKNVGAGTGDIVPWNYPGETNGYHMGGTPTGSWTLTNIIQKVVFATEANATDLADLTVARRFCAGASSDTYGFCIGGYQHNEIDRFSFASGSNATDVGDTSFSSQVTGCSSSTHGYCVANGGGGTPAGVTIEKFSNTSLGNTTDVGDLTHNHNSTGGGASSADYGYTCGASYPTGQGGDKIDKFSFASGTQNASLIGLTSNQLFGNGALSSLTYGYCVSGAIAGPNSTSNKIEKWSFSSDGNASDIADMTVAHTDLNNNTCQSTTNGYTMGGWSGGRINNLQRVSFTTDSNSVDVADMFGTPLNGAGANV